jgi:amino acid permease
LNKKLEYKLEETKPVKTKVSKKKKANLEDEEYFTNPYAITTRTELGLMAEQFLGPIGKYIFFVFMIIYLFGDLAIFAVSVPATILKATGTISGLTREVTHSIYVAIFGLIVIPFSFFNFQKTKYLQIFTLVTRNVALASMILLSIIFIGQGKVKFLLIEANHCRVQA